MRNDPIFEKTMNEIGVIEKLKFNLFAGSSRGLGKKEPESFQNRLCSVRVQT
jgi:hypothetical protein